MITLADYYMGLQTSLDLDQGRKARAVDTVRRINRLLEVATADGVAIAVDPRSGSLVVSGWRPASAAHPMSHVATHLRHVECEACDLYDPAGELDEWCLCHLDVLKDLGLWLEHPAATKGWCHLQTVAPKSGRQVFYP